MTQKLPWRVVWITGASTGIGFEVARQLARHGISVAASARRESPDFGSANVRYFKLDVTDAAAVAQTSRAIEEQLGPIDLCLFAAGRYKASTPGHFDLAAETAMNQANYIAVLNCIAAVLPTMIKRKAGRLAWIASVAGYGGLPRSAGYGPTKAALINLAESLHLELAGTGVGISVINPGFVKTPMTDHNDFPMPFMITAEDAARRTIAGLAAGRFETAYPRRFVYILKFLGLLPYWLYFRLVGLGTRGI